MSDAFPLTGARQTEPEPVLLRAGLLSAELVNGNLRAVRWAGIEVLRAISYLVRDRDWGTLDPALSDLRVEEKPDAFAVAYSASCDALDGSRLILEAIIEGTADGTLRFDVTATPQGDFETNRCGFCILHPIVGLAGSPVVIERTDGQVLDMNLPDLIDPRQPFKEMRAITHRVADGVSAECRMEGDTAGMDGWEMEDQRNWTDASYKTYVRPLELPWPYTLADAQPVGQSVRLTIKGDLPAAAVTPAAEHGAIRVTLGRKGPKMPAVGVAIAPEDAGTALDRLDRLRELGAQRLLFHFDPTAGHGLAALQSFAAVADIFPAKTTLECVVAAEGGSGADVQGELAHTAALVREAGLRLDAVAVSPSVDRQSTPPGSRWPDCPLLEAVYAAARKAFPAQKLGGGMFSYFTELNRKRVPADALDFITHTTCPIVHAADDLSVMQTLEALPFVTASVRAIFGGKPYRIGPSTIAMRQNPYGSATKANPGNERVPMANRDPRHNALFGAAWAAGYAAAVVPAGLEELTLSGFTGPFGLLAGAGEPAPEGGPRPLFHVVRALAALAGLMSLEIDTENDDRVAVLAARSAEGSLRVLCANLTPDRLMLDLSALALGKEASVVLVDAEAAKRGDTGRMPLRPAEFPLGPYAVAFIG